MKQKELITDLTEGPVTKQLITFAIPFVLSSMLQTAYNLVDMVVVGRFVGAAGLSAVGISGHLIQMITAIGIGFASAGQILISQQVGSGDKKGINSTVGTLMSLLLLLAIVFGAVGLVSSRGLLTIMNTPEAAMSQGVGYMVICSLGMIFIYGYNAVSAILRGMGESKLPLVFIAIASVVNLILDLVFVAGLRMEAQGAALATVIGQAVSFVMAVVYLYRKRESFVFDFKPKSFKILPQQAKAIFKLGVPMTVQSLTITASILFVNSQVNAFGLVASAVDSVGGKLHGVMGIVTSSMCAATGAMVGQNFGARRFDRVSRVHNVSVAICLGFYVIVAACCLLLPTQIFSIFNTDPQVLEMAPRYMCISAIFYLAFATMASPLGVVNGIGAANFALFVGILDGVVVRIALCLILGYACGMGLEGFWLGNALAGFVSTILAGGYYLSGRWKKRSAVLTAASE